MNDLSDYPTEQLEAELAERKRVAKKLLPLFRDEMNFDTVIEMTVAEVSERVRTGEHDPQTVFNEYLEEEVVQAVYGEDVYDKLDKVCS